MLTTQRVWDKDYDANLAVEFESGVEGVSLHLDGGTGQPAASIKLESKAVHDLILALQRYERNLP
jgi:hypothetical protein